MIRFFPCIENNNSFSTFFYQILFLQFHIKRLPKELSEALNLLYLLAIIR